MMIKNNRAQKKPVEGSKFFRWVGHPLAVFGLAVGLLCGSCRTIYVPVETDTSVSVKDSTAIHYIDSIRITEATRYKDLAWLGDTLKIEGTRSRMWAAADTTKGALLGGLEEDKVEEKTKVVYKDKIVYRDSIRTEEKPVPVEVTKEIKIIPKWLVILSIIGVISTLLLLFMVYLKFRK